MIVDITKVRRRDHTLRGLGLTPGYTPAQQAMADAYAASMGGGGGAPATYVAPSTIALPACTQDTRPGGAAFSSACINLLLANQSANMGQANLSNYDVDLANCLNTFPQPTNCYERTFGLTPVGGYTGGVNILTPNAQQFITGIAPIIAPPLASTATPTAIQNQVNKTPPVAQQLVMASGSAGSGGIIDTSSITSALGGDVSVMGYQIPIWAIGIAVVGGLVLLGGRH
jgi:hypothetical protein